MSEKNSIHIDPGQLAIVKDILRKHIPNNDVWAFGSRVHGRNLRKFSDLDLYPRYFKIWVRQNLTRGPHVRISTLRPLVRFFLPIS